jgi:hypothetical protein
MDTEIRKTIFDNCEIKEEDIRGRICGEGSNALQRIYRDISSIDREITRAEMKHDGIKYSVELLKIEMIKLERTILEGHIKREELFGKIKDNQ